MLARLLVAAPQGREHVAEVAAADELHAEEGPLIRESPEVVDGDDVGVLEPARELRLAHEARREAAVRALAQDLDRDLAVEPLVARGVDDGRAAVAHDVAELVPGLARDVGRRLLALAARVVARDAERIEDEPDLAPEREVLAPAPEISVRVLGR